MNERDELAELLRATVLSVIERPFPEVDFDTPIAHMGVDSVSLAEIVTLIEDRLDIEIPVEEWLHADTLGDFVDAIERARHKQL
jgi:acyl carrier protein